MIGFSSIEHESCESSALVFSFFNHFVGRGGISVSSVTRKKNQHLGQER